ncbi:protein farnesyltransferase/geranylgeranyltransferase type-1 subunit alpha-like [Mya arenaria]|uniref:protein farnesyltransferase/geranylgeranyltransferase type-1 subunit alpha-like n=1 Tax=Mya arenaria TaxID=6604 RepID=UPI0022E7E07B|nr:protein farnesyltransferase/geranylgeranyltransferase type-1 subunit alpha-like [Mya arenaria]XP_052772543.1 protein farnesyltransferase/geranylgeranyltransferase type-1 subunit alpha-like [Mya arenaria]
MSDSSSDESSRESWTPYCERDEWNDVEPVSQDDGPHPVVQIAYSDKFRDVYDYFRAVVARNEVSDRALELTRDAATLNPANYTVWHYRRECLAAMNKDLHKELTYITNVINKHPKNYQVWHHRRVIVERLQDPGRELDFTASILQDDAKNYHAWQHRQWVIREFDLWDNELGYVEKLLRDDLRNNSAWNQRYFVVNHTTGFTDDVIEREIRFTQDYIKKAPNNESAWNYLKGVLLDRQLQNYPSVLAFCQQLYEDRYRSPYLMAYMIDTYEEMLEQESDDRAATLKKAEQLCNALADEYDQIRGEYWNYVARSLTSRYGSQTNTVEQEVS